MKHQPAASATLDMDATLIETHKRDALFCYKKFKAYQPLNCWWAEQGVMLYSEFRDGNVPAGHEQLRVLKESLSHLPDSVKKVSSALGYGGVSGRIAAVLRRGEGPALWRDRVRDRRRRDRGFSRGRAGDGGERVEAADPLGGRQAATDRSGMGRDLSTCPSWAGHSRKRADYRFLAIREPLRQLALGDEANCRFPPRRLARRGSTSCLAS